MTKPSHHTTNGFRNPWQVERKADRGLKEIVKCHLRLGPDEPCAVPPEKVPKYQPVRVEPDLKLLKNPADPKAFQITWIGHTTFLIQHGGFNILTDPMFGKRASPVPFIGPRRHTPPGVALDQLPKIDLVLVSHNHYDHLDLDTVKFLGEMPQWAVPLGNRRWFQNLGIDSLREFDWWESEGFEKAFEVHCVPAQHFAGRSITDRNQSLWCGWVIESQYGSLYFAGDTGYGSLFTEIGIKFSGFDVAIIPIGAYKPRWFMSPIHCDAKEAAQIHQEVKAKNSIASHWGTFRLTTEPLAEPPIYLAAACAELGIEPQAFTTMNFGETRIIA